MNINNVNCCNLNKEVKELKCQLSTLFGYVVALRLENIREHRKIEAYLSVLTKKAFENREKGVDYISACRDLEKDFSSFEEWESWDSKEL